jgi:CheY-like chemotaxis protein
VLVVDDDPDARELVAFTLQTAGAAIQSASSAADALHSILRDRPDAIIADIGMAHEDGYVLIQKLRAHEREAFRGRLPAIALTGYASAADRDQALAAGYDVHLAKPVGPGDLIRAVAKFLMITRSQVQTTQT